MSDFLDFIRAKEEKQGLLDKVKDKVPGTKKKDESAIDVDNLCPSLTLKQRALGFAFCIILGITFNILGWIMLMENDIVRFAVAFSCGNLCSLFGTLFLAGPIKQVKKMFQETRIVATCAYLFFLAATLTAALVIPDKEDVLRVVVVVILALCQYLALIWYGLSWIPFARTAVKAAFRNMNCFF
eukprot:TRINITY_DN69113_c0_g1_i1.p1 TRINITY_DN69113_c0_g1~~TRINITY_DN69113_c0_g1_i1.p1  ORF type:complete len:184 (-),score=15.76 TRINITY_DN69113_c0_g1_i1:160-711(-)